MPPKQETFYTITAARASDLEHFFAVSIAVGAGEQSRSRRREPGRGDGREAGCEKWAVDEQVRGYAECARTRGAIWSTFSRGVSRWERSSNREAGGGSADAGAGELAKNARA